MNLLQMEFVYQNLQKPAFKQFCMAAAIIGIYQLLDKWPLFIQDLLQEMNNQSSINIVMEIFEAIPDAIEAVQLNKTQKNKIKRMLILQQKNNDQNQPVQNSELLLSKFEFLLSQSQNYNLQKILIVMEEWAKFGLQFLIKQDLISMLLQIIDTNKDIQISEKASSVIVESIEHSYYADILNIVENSKNSYNQSINYDEFQKQLEVLNLDGRHQYLSINNIANYLIQKQEIIFEKGANWTQIYSNQASMNQKIQCIKILIKICLQFNIILLLSNQASKNLLYLCNLTLQIPNYKISQQSFDVWSRLAYAIQYLSNQPQFNENFDYIYESFFKAFQDLLIQCKFKSEKQAFSNDQEEKNEEEDDDSGFGGILTLNNYREYSEDMFIQIFKVCIRCLEKNNSSFVDKFFQIIEQRLDEQYYLQDFFLTNLEQQNQKLIFEQLKSNEQQNQFQNFLQGLTQTDIQKIQFSAICGMEVAIFAVSQALDCCVSHECESNFEQIVIKIVKTLPKNNILCKTALHYLYNALPSFRNLDEKSDLIYSVFNYILSLLSNENINKIDSICFEKLTQLKLNSQLTQEFFNLTLIKIQQDTKLLENENIKDNLIEGLFKLAQNATQFQSRAQNYKNCIDILNYFIRNIDKSQIGKKILLKQQFINVCDLIQAAFNGLDIQCSSEVLLFKKKEMDLIQMNQKKQEIQQTLFPFLQQNIQFILDTYQTLFQNYQDVSIIQFTKLMQNVIVVFDVQDVNFTQQIIQITLQILYLNPVKYCYAIYVLTTQVQVFQLSDNMQLKNQLFSYCSQKLLPELMQNVIDNKNDADYLKSFVILAKYIYQLSPIDFMQMDQFFYNLMSYLLNSLNKINTHYTQKEILIFFEILISNNKENIQQNFQSFIESLVNTVLGIFPNVLQNMIFHITKLLHKFSEVAYKKEMYGVLYKSINNQQNKLLYQKMNDSQKQLLVNHILLDESKINFRMKKCFLSNVYQFLNNRANEEIFQENVYLSSQQPKQDIVKID